MQIPPRVDPLLYYIVDSIDYQRSDRQSTIDSTNFNSDDDDDDDDPKMFFKSTKTRVFCN